MAQSAVLTLAEAQQSAVNHGHYVYIGSRYMLSMHSIHICGVCMYAYAPFCDQETFELRMYLLYTYIYVICCMPRLPAPAAVVCIYTQLSWAIGPAGPVCVCVCPCACAISIHMQRIPDHGLGQIPRWIPTCRRVALYFVCMPRSFLEATMRKNQIDTHAHTHTHRLTHRVPSLQWVAQQLYAPGVLRC